MYEPTSANILFSKVSFAYMQASILYLPFQVIIDNTISGDNMDKILSPFPIEFVVTTRYIKYWNTSSFPRRTVTKNRAICTRHIGLNNNDSYVTNFHKNMYNKYV